VEILRQIKEWGFNVKLVLADSLYGESGDVIGVLSQLNFHFM
jgi:SRSO17 transposase